MTTNVGKLEAELTLDSSGFRSGLSSAQSSLSQGAMNMGKQLGQIGGVLSMALTLPAAGLAAYTGKVFMDYEKSMNMLQAVTEASTDEMAAMADMAKQLGADMTLPATSAGDAALAMTELAKGGLSVADSMDAARGTIQLAAAAGMSEANAANLVATSLNMFSLAGSDATIVADMFANAANKSAAEISDLGLGLQMSGSIFAQTGMKIDDATASLAIMSNAGIRGSDAGTSLKTMLMRLMAPTDKAAAELKSLGISIYDSEGNMRNMTDIIGQFNAALGENATRTVTVGGATNKMANAAKSAGTNIAPLTTKVQQQQAELAILQRELAATTAKYGASSTQAQRKQLTLDKLSTSLATNKGKLIAATNAIGTYQAAAAGATTATVAMTQEQRNEALATIFGTDAIRAANIVLMGGVDSYTEMKDAVNTAGAAQELAGARTKGLAGAIDGLQSVIEGILIDVGEKFAPMLENLVRIIGALLPMVQSLDPSLVASAAAFAAVFVAAGPVLTIIGAIVTAIGFLLSPIGLVITAIALLAAAWAGNWGDIRGKTKAAIDFLGGLFEGFKSLVVGVFQAIVQFIVDRIDNVIGAINWFIDKVNDAIGLLNQLPGVSIGAISKIETLSERGGLLGIGGVETPSAIEAIGPTALNIQGNVYLDSRKVGNVVWDDLKTRRLIGTQLGLVP